MRVRLREAMCVGNVVKSTTLQSGAVRMRNRLRDANCVGNVVKNTTLQRTSQ